jgi:hypothetical protein
MLSEDLGDETDFVAINGAIRHVIDLENPLAANDMMTTGRFHETSGIVEAKRIKLHIHNFFPHWTWVQLQRLAWTSHIG